MEKSLRRQKMVNSIFNKVTYSFLFYRADFSLKDELAVQKRVIDKLTQLLKELENE